MNFKKTAIVLVVFIVTFLVWDNLKLTRILLPCEEPVLYTIGTFDRRFGISQKDFLEALTMAEAIWEKPSGMDLFVYAPETGKLVVNLIYDYRQETTSTLSDIESVVEEDESAYKLLQSKYTNLKKAYDSAKGNYEAKVEIFDEKNVLYQEYIEDWNSGDRTSREQFAKLESEKVALQSEARELKLIEIELNKMVGEINVLVGTLNRLARSLNLSVEAYNTIGASRGESFTGGVYYSADGVEGIDIYEFSSHEKLVRILAHELGHALGLEHVDTQEAVMYYLNEGDAALLAEEGLAALKTLCYTEDIKN